MRKLLPIVMASAVLAAPAVADAATVRNDRGVVIYQGTPGENNNPRLRTIGGEFAIVESVPLFAGPGCRPITSTEVRCGTVNAAEIRTGDQNDGVSVEVPVITLVEGGDGDDHFLGGRVPGVSRVQWHGGPGNDTVTYVAAQQPVRIFKNDALDDGRPGDRDKVARDVETVAGSNFDDVILGGGPGIEVFDGNLGNDQLFGVDGQDHFIGDSQRDGADHIDGGPDRDLVIYDRRQAGVRVSMDGVADDGEPGEGDNVLTSTESVFGTRFTDVLTGAANITNVLQAGAGDDFVDGLGGGNGRNTADFIGCGLGTDRHTNRRNELTRDCEALGAFALAPRKAVVRGGSPVNLKLRWSAHESWQQLRRIELRLRDGKREVGRVLLDPHTETLTARGRAKARAIRVKKSGNDVELAFALRVDGRAGRKLTAELGAVGADGARQEFQRAGTLLVR